VSAPAATAILGAQGISVNFGGLRGLIGPNGAGKTTFIDALTGFVPCTGRFQIGGEEITGLPPHARARRGLARTWQSIELFDDLTVRENLAVAAHRPSVLATIKETLSRPLSSSSAIERALDVLDLRESGEALPADLPQGQRKLIGVARALAAAPRVLCLDEPAAGLDTAESTELGVRLRRVVDNGTSILLVDHDMGLVLGISDYVYVLEFGKIIAHGPPDTVRRDPQVITAYLGTAAEEADDFVVGREPVAERQTPRAEEENT
jgi:branched-chain amino acid transport system ATP-binding protein